MESRSRLRHRHAHVFAITTERCVLQAMHLTYRHHCSRSGLDAQNFSEQPYKSQQVLNVITAARVAWLHMQQAHQHSHQIGNELCHQTASRFYKLNIRFLTRHENAIIRYFQSSGVVQEQSNSFAPCKKPHRPGPEVQRKRSCTGPRFPAYRGDHRKAQT